MVRQKDSVTFEVWGAVPSKANFRYSSRSKESRDGWRKIKNYEHTVGNAALAAGARYGRHPIPIALTVTVINQRCDIDNALKCPVDGLKEVVIPDDTPEWLPDIRVLYEGTDDGEPRVRYTIRYLGNGKYAA